MKTIIAGSRTIFDYKLLCQCVDYAEMYFKHSIDEVVCGMALGADLLGLDWAKEHNVEWKEFKPNYKKYGRYVAPKKRNMEMGDYADNAIILWDGISTGSIHMRDYMTEIKKNWILFNIKERTISSNGQFKSGLSFL